MIELISKHALGYLLETVSINVEPDIDPDSHYVDGFRKAMNIALNAVKDAEVIATLNKGKAEVSAELDVERGWDD